MNLHRKTTQGEPAIVEQLMDECRAMARYALASGLKVPASVLHTVATLDGLLAREDDTSGEAASPEKAGGA